MSLRERLLGRRPADTESGQEENPALEKASQNGSNGAGTALAAPPVGSSYTAEITSPHSVGGASLAGLVANSGSISASEQRKTRSEQELSPVEQLKITLHRRLIDALDLEALEKITDEAVLTAQIRAAVLEFLRGETTPLSQAEREEIIEQIVYEVTGCGPLEPLFRDKTISDILVNGPYDIYVERRGKLTRVNTVFRNDAHLLSIIDRIVSKIGRRVDESSPMVDARLQDGSRVNAIIPPLALDGAVLSIRRFGAQFSMQQLMEYGALTEDMALFLAACVRARLNILVSGGTGSGKTTMLNALSSFIQNDHRVITIEDAAELRLQQDHVVRLETRPPNAEGRGEVVARDLVKNALRMRPDRIIVGEVRAGEAFDMLQAKNTGHDGSMTTVHANSPRDALSRVEQMIGMSGIDIPARASRQQIASALDVVLQVARLSDGRRKIISMSELTGMEGEVVTMQEIFRFRQTGVSGEGIVQGRFEATGIRPRFLDQVMAHGITLSPDLFRPDAKFDA